MSGVDLSLSIGLILALALSVGNHRAWAWLGAAALSYVVSTIYWRLDLPYAPFIGGLVDAAICLGVYFFARYRWEMWVWRLFQVSMLVNLVYLGGTLSLWPSLSHNAYAVILEAVNWLAWVWIGGNGAVQVMGTADDDLHSPASGLWRLVRALSRERTNPAFHKAAG